MESQAATLDDAIAMHDAAAAGGGREGQGEGGDQQQQHEHEQHPDPAASAPAAPSVDPAASASESHFSSPSPVPSHPQLLDEVADAADAEVAAANAAAGVVADERLGGAGGSGGGGGSLSAHDLSLHAQAHGQHHGAMIASPAHGDVDDVHDQSSEPEIGDASSVGGGAPAAGPAGAGHAGEYEEEYEDGAYSEGDDDEEYEDGEDDEDEEEEEEEPKLKYQRLGASVSTIVKRDSARCILAHEKFLVLGTASGKLYVLDLNGNEILQFQPHTAPINDLSLDASGDHVASASQDGTVVITNLFTKETSRHAYPRAVRSVALPGAYKSGGMFALGGAEGKFIINTRGWFSNKDVVIHAGEGPVGAVRWRRELLAWANDFGVKVYDVNTSERIAHIPRLTPVPAGAPQPPPPPPAELYRCNLCWSKDDTLLIGWADSVKIGVVKTRAHVGPGGGGGGGAGGAHRPGSSSSAVPSGGHGSGPTGSRPMTVASTSRYVQIVAMFSTDFMVAGIAPWGDHHLVLMAFLEDEADKTSSAKRAAAAAAAAPRGGQAGAGAGARSSVTGPSRPTNSQRPELRIVTYTNEEVSSDALPIVGYQNYCAADYRLDFNPNGGGAAAAAVLSNHHGAGQNAATAAAAAAQAQAMAAAAAAGVPALPGSVGVPTAGMGGSLGALGSSSSSSSSAAAAAAAAAAAPNLDYLFYILAPSDIVVARPRDYDDHVSWLLARGRFEEALHYARAFSQHLKVHNVYDIGEQFLADLFEVQHDYAKAADYCTRLLGNSKSLWETYIFLFVKHDKLAYVADVIPTSNPTLSDSIYELVLHSYLERGPGKQGHDKLLQLLGKWSHHLYNIAHVIDSIKTKLAEIENNPDMYAAMPPPEDQEGDQAQRGEAGEGGEITIDAAAAAIVAPSPSVSEGKYGAFSSGVGGIGSGAQGVGALNPALYPPPPPLPPPSTRVLLECLAQLFLLNKQYAHAFDMYVQLQRREELFRILSAHAPSLLGPKLVDQRMVPALMRISLRDSVELLLAQVERVGPREVVEQLRAAAIAAKEPPPQPPQATPAAAAQQQQQGGAAGARGAVAGTGAGASSGASAAPVVTPTYRAFQYEYLHALFRKEHSNPSALRFHDDQVLLYAEFAPAGLLYFLKNSTGYTLERALAHCERYALYGEMVFLLKRMGNTERALGIIIDQLKDVKEAINFVEECGGRSISSGGKGSHSNGGGGGGDGEEEEEENSLWESLITRSLSNPAFLSDLLEHVGSHYVDLRKLIVRIPAQLEIPQLRQKLVTILNDCELQQSVIRGCTTILRNDCKNLVGRLYRRRKRAVKVPLGARCALCDVEVFAAGGSAAGEASGGAAAARGHGHGAAGGSVLVFFCRHVMHRSCADSQRSLSERRTAEQVCPRCNVHGAHAANNHAALASPTLGPTGSGSALTPASSPSQFPQGGSGTGAGLVRARYNYPSSSPPAATSSGGRAFPPLPGPRSILPAAPSPSPSDRHAPSAPVGTGRMHAPLPGAASQLPPSAAGGHAHGHGRGPSLSAGTGGVGVGRAVSPSLTHFGSALQSPSALLHPAPGPQQQQQQGGGSGGAAPKAQPLGRQPSSVRGRGDSALAR